MKIGQKIPSNHVVKGKGSRQEFLPSRFALSKLTEGSPADRSVSEYARRTPSGAAAPTTYADIMAMGQKGIDIDRK